MSLLLDDEHFQSYLNHEEGNIVILNHTHSLFVADYFSIFAHLTAQLASIVLSSSPGF